MKNFILLSWLLFLSQAAFSQVEWAPVGARWWYTEHFFGNNFPVKYEVIGQEEIGGKTCEAFFLTSFWGDSILFHMHEEEGQVWIYSTADSSFHLRYDFNLPQGGTWQSTYYLGDTLTFVVDTVRWKNYDGQLMKVQEMLVYRSGCPECVESESVIEGIGNDEYHAVPYPAEISGEVYFSLNCYDDPISEVISFDNLLDCEALATPAFERKKSKHLQLKTYPNPVGDVLRFGFSDYNAPPSGAASFRISNTLGQVIVQVKADRFQETLSVPVEGWAAGLYFLQYLEAGILRQTEMFIKQ